MTDAILPLIGGFVLLVVGGELLVRGAVQIASRLGVSPLIIGLTLVGFGTSTPELVTSVQAALAGSPGIAYGNIVGSNIANALLIIGASAMLCPIVVASDALRRDGVVMVAAAVVFCALAAVMPLGRVAGSVLMLGLVLYLWLTIRRELALRSGQHGAVFEKSQALQQTDPAMTPDQGAAVALWRSLAMALAGLAAVVAGGHFLVDGAVALARAFGVSETVIGLTIVAIGTSMPELVTSVVAAAKRHGDVAFGNVIGSNIYNILGIGGATALIAPSDAPEQIVYFDNLIMLGVCCIMMFVAYTGMRIVRPEGAVLLLGYAAYIALTWPMGG